MRRVRKTQMALRRDVKAADNPKGRIMRPVDLSPPKKRQEDRSTYVASALPKRLDAVQSSKKSAASPGRKHAARK